MCQGVGMRHAVSIELSPEQKNELRLVVVFPRSSGRAERSGLLLV